MGSRIVWIAITASACASARHDRAPDGGERAAIADASDDARIAPVDGSTAITCTTGVGSGCYAIRCNVAPQSLQANRDRLIADLARRRCVDSCTLWGALDQAERYIFVMDTAYFGAPASKIYPTATGKLDTALDHATALYSINGPDGSTLGGLDYNRIYLGFDALAECVMRDFPIANPTNDPSGNSWVKSDDIAGPHAPFTQREMIFWYRALYDPQSEGPQFHHWHQDSDFTQSGIDQRLGVCGVGDRSLVESTIAFDFYHNSDPLGDYQTRGGYGWQIVDQHAGIAAQWDYAPTGCAPSPPVDTKMYGGTYAGMGPSLVNGTCTPRPPIVPGGC